MRLNITDADCVTYRRTYEYAAWHTDMRAISGSFELVRTVTDPGTPYERVRYVASVPALITSDYFASHLGGVPVGKYDTKQNEGRADMFQIGLTPWQLLSHKSVEISEVEYDKLLSEALTFLRAEIETTMRCLESHRKDGAYHWMTGHAATLAHLTKSYDEAHFTKERRKYNVEQAATGREGWKDPNETHVARVYGFTNGAA